MLCLGPEDLRSEVDASWCGTLKATQQLSEQELLVGCKSFKQEQSFTFSWLPLVIGG